MLLTVLEYETPTDYTGKFYIAALINGPGVIEFFPNSRHISIVFIMKPVIILVQQVRL